MTIPSQLVAVFEISDQASDIFREQAVADATVAVRDAALAAGFGLDQIAVTVSEDGRTVVANAAGIRSFESHVVADGRPDRWSVSRRPHPHIPTAAVAREEWKALGKRVRREILAEAKRGRPWRDQGQARTAIGWAWAVLGPPTTRRGKADSIFGQIFYVATSALGGSGYAAGLGDIFGGSPTHDDNPGVIRAARRVEAANLDVATG